MAPPMKDGDNGKFLVELVFGQALLPVFGEGCGLLVVLDLSLYPEKRALSIGGGGLSCGGFGQSDRIQEVGLMLFTLLLFWVTFSATMASYR